MDLNQIEKSRWVEGEREEERRVKQLSPRFMGPSHLRKGQLGAPGSALSVIRRHSLRNLLCQRCCSGLTAQKKERSLGAISALGSWPSGDKQRTGLAAEKEQPSVLPAPP